MSETSDPSDKNRNQRIFNLALAAVASQVGCLTLVIVIGALIGGLWLDSRLHSRPIFTILLMIASVPVTLVAMFWVVRKTTAQIRTESKPTSSQPGSGDEIK